MDTFRLFSLILLGSFLSSCTYGGPSHQDFSSTKVTENPTIAVHANIIFMNGVVLTMNQANATAQALAIKDDKILAVGTTNEILKLRDANTNIIDLAGNTLMPGFVDAHSHMIFSSHNNEDFSRFQEMAIKGGITTETEMTVTPDLMNQLLGFEKAGLLRLRFNTYLAYNDSCGHPFDSNWYKTYKQGENLSAHIRNQGVKIFSDGGACNVPAVTFEYPGGYGNGDLYMTQDELTAVVKAVQDSGYQVAIHALGDRAIEEAQNAIGMALNGAPNTYRHRIEHNAVLHDNLLPRYNQIGIIPVIFGSYPTCWRVNSTAQFKYVVPVSLGTWEWPWRALLDENPGIKAAWHSDYPVFPNIDPIAHLYGFVTRNQISENGSVCLAPEWLKKGAITVDEALHIMTINSAYALFREKEIGSLESGKYADLIILSDNPLKVDAEKIKDISISMTMIGGNVEYCQPGDESLCPLTSSGLQPASINTDLPETATASASLRDHPPEDAMDSSNETWWSAGSGPEQWIQIDLGKPTIVRTIRLVVSQYPEGNTTHQIWAGSDATNLTLVYEFKGTTKDLDTLEYSPSNPLSNIRFIKIVTTQSPSWVAWRGIIVNGK